MTAWTDPPPTDPWKDMVPPCIYGRGPYGRGPYGHYTDAADIWTPWWTDPPVKPQPVTWKREKEPAHG